MDKKRSIHFITYGEGGHSYEMAKRRICNEARNVGWFDTIKPFGYKDLSSDFKHKYDTILQLKKGGGFWIWKVDIILQTLQSISDGDYVVYLDAGCTINPHGKERFFEYLNMLDTSEYGVIDFEMQGPFSMTKRQCTKQVFDYFGMDTSSELVNRGHCVPGALVIKKNRHIELILHEFLKLLDTDPYLVTDKYNKMQQHDSYWDHRHDQSIFTCLFMKYGALQIKRNETYSFGDTQEDHSPENGKYGSAPSLKYPFWATRYR